MKIILLRAFSFSAALLFLQSASAADATLSPRLTFELRDGSRVVGVSTEDTFKFHSALLGDLQLAVKDIRAVDCVSSNSARLTTANGDTLKVAISGAAYKVKTSFGKIELAAESVRRLSVAAGAGAAPMRDSLVGYWPGSGNAQDSTGDNHGELVGSVNFAAGPAGQAFNFDAPGSFVKIPRTASLDPGRQVTVEFWMKADATNAMQNYQGLVTSDFYGVEISNGYGGTMGVNCFVSLTASQPERWGGQFFSGQTTVGNFTHISDANGGGAPVSADQWHHIAATYDGRILRLYVDGALWGEPVNRPGVIAPMLPESFVAIGSEDGRKTCPDCIGSRNFKGQIASVAIYKRALTAAEIREDFEAIRPN